MSDKGYPTGQPDAAEEASLFSQIMGDDDGNEAQTEQRAAPEPDEGEGDERDESSDESEQGRGRDDKGRFAKPEPKQDARQAQGEDRAQRGLRKEITGERGKRQTAEAERDAERREREADRQEMARLRGVVEQFTRQQQQPAQQQRPAQVDAPPDRWTDPEGYDKWRDARLEQQFQARLEQQQQERARFSFEDANAQHGAAFQEAYRALDGLNPQDPANRAQAQRVMASPNPGEALMRWYASEKARQEIGQDPVAYRERLRAEFTDPSKLLEDPATRERIIAQLRAEAGQGGQNGGARSSYTLPPSLNGARGNSTRGGTDQDQFDNSDRGVFRAALSG